MREEIHIMSPSGARLSAVLEMVNPTGEMVIISHGFRSSKDSRTSLSVAEALAHEGMNSVRFDYYGHGDSTGEFADVTLTKALADLQAVLSFVRDRGYDRVGLFGSSFGGMVSLLAASRDTELFAVVLKSPVVDYSAKEIHRRGEKGIEQWKEVGMVEYQLPNGVTLPLYYDFYEDTLQYAGYEYVSDVIAPTLFIHGDRDAVVPVEQSVEAVKRVQDGILVHVEEANHFYDKKEHFDEMLSLTTSFFTHRAE